MDRAGVTQEQLQAMANDIKNALRPGEIAQLIRLIGPTPSTGEMTAAEFESLVKKLKAKSTRRGYSDTSIAAARLVMVMGATKTEAADELGMTRAGVGQAIKRIRRQVEDIPKDWVPVSTWLPVGIAEQLEGIEAALMDGNASEDDQGPSELTLVLR